MKKAALVIIALSALFVAGLSGIFVGRRLSGRYTLDGRFYANRQPGPRMWGRMDGGFYGGYKGALSGQITKIESGNITIQRPDGGGYTKTINDQTAINKVAKGSKDDLKVGQKISVYGAPSVSGSYNAQEILFRADSF